MPRSRLETRTRRNYDSGERIRVGLESRFRCPTTKQLNAKYKVIRLTLISLSPSRSLRALPFAGALALAAALVPVAAGTALAAPALPADCTQSGNTVTCTYTAGGETAFAVPQGVSSVTATVVGAQGGADSSDNVAGGLGAVASGTITVTGGETLYAEVDILGGAPGVESNGFVDGGAGGGESDVRTCSATATCASGTTLASRLLVGAGGGGTGDLSGGAGGNAGTTGPGAAGTDGGGFRTAGNGGGATVSAPGTAGAACPSPETGDPGAAGAPGGGAGGAGGDATTTNGNSGGGGGAGWFGGGGGGGCLNANDNGGGGGGGSSYAAPSVANASFVQATGGEAASVTLVYTAPVVSTACTTTITGSHPTQLTVASGITCLTNATQHGQVTVDAGAGLIVTDSTVDGTVTATSPVIVSYCGSTEDGTLTVSDATGNVTLGDGGSCAADTIPSLITITGTAGTVTVNGLKENGTLTLSGNTGGVDLAGIQLSGLVYVQDNTGTSPVTVAGNTINGSLNCSGNTPAPADNGSVNTVTGTASGQCAAPLSQR